MAFETNNNTENNTENNTVKSVKVTRARKLSNTCVFFNAIVNDITIYDLSFVFFKDKETGEEKSFISFPSTKYKDKEGNDAYFPLVRFTYTESMKEDIYKQITELLKKDNEK